MLGFLKTIFGLGSVRRPIDLHNTEDTQGTVTLLSGHFNCCLTVLITLIHINLEISDLGCYEVKIGFRAVAVANGPAQNFGAWTGPSAPAAPLLKGYWEQRPEVCRLHRKWR